MPMPSIKAVLAVVCLLALTGCTQTPGYKVNETAMSSTYNHRLSLRMQHRQRLLNEIALTCDEAKVRGKELCPTSTPLRCRLMYRHRRLFYRLKTDGCYVDVDAVDGTVIRYEAKKEGKA